MLFLTWHPLLSATRIKTSTASSEHEHMSVINCIRSKDGLAVFTDGAAYDQDGRLTSIASKILILPHASTVISVRGISDFIIPLYAIVHRCRTFGDVLNAVQADAKFCDTSKFDNPLLISEVVIAGYSRERDAFEIYYLPGHEHAAHLGFPAFKLTRIARNCWFPSPDPEVAKQIGWHIPAWNESDADRDGINLMECQRREKFGAGGFIHRTDITRAGINSRILKYWQDEVGRPVEPGHYEVRKSEPPPVPRRFLETTAALGRQANGL
jgi:hypothetical protein